MGNLKFRLCDILVCLARAVDLISPELNKHHQSVSYLAYRIAEHIGMSQKVRRAVLIEGLMHDIGALSLQERLSLLEEAPGAMSEHALRSAKLLSGCPILAGFADAVKYHHVPWDYGRGTQFDARPVPLTSHILHLADRAVISIEKSSNVLAEIPGIIRQLRKNEDKIFAPLAIQALVELSAKEYIWLEMDDNDSLNFLPATMVGKIKVDLDDVLCISKVFSYIIDFRSHFTATHSAGVAKTAQRLAQLAGMMDDEQKMMLIAGYLHDLGKLVIKDSLLEKPDKLSAAEYGKIRGHTFYTYRLLSKIKGFDTINQWASLHHERLDGSGYPFHLKGGDIPLGSRIMMVADIFNAIVEHRPYRKGMRKPEVIKVMRNMTDGGLICPVVSDLLLNNLDLFIEECKTAQREASEEYESFFLGEDEEKVV